MSSPVSSSSFSALSSPMDSPPAASHPPHTPNKRHPSTGFSDHSPLLAHHHSPSHLTHLSDISSDTSGSVPGSPSDDDFDHAEQVTVCRWDGCDCDLGDMDALVKHIHDSHIGSRRAKYACEWDDCTRKGMAHASGYALRAHMRSHTKEKPFYCTLPECDRSFTRSDALAKHMRTVHETEALRPSDPIPKSHPNHPHNHRRDAARAPSTSPSASEDGSASGEKKNPWYQPEDGFDHDEDTRPPRELMRLLKRKLAWAEQSREELKGTLEGLEKRRRRGWVRKEVLLDRVIECEIGAEEAKELSLDLGVLGEE
ncbi:uncharacterized protein H6S33_007504 [Morchella sextelata]|uniref:uncharacterized protein n=1 Tax=Morchella sextelata TaxID=1174677 RepID=UPI001D04390D|nr:uncharacterized protein H6S33_007504 [Morchella sextelata]KAH0603845.1 hypothetical protein H6S33_007504 [Morchella sextelata]